MKILLVEDDQAIRETLILILKAEGFVVETATSALTAIVAFTADRPDLILLDWLLEDGEAKPILKHVQASQVPVILLTAASKAESIVEAEKIKYLLKKPFDIEQLIQILQDALKAATETRDSA